MDIFPLNSYFTEHEARTSRVTETYPNITVDSDTPAYLQPFIDYWTLRWKIPDRELNRFEDQWDTFCVMTMGHREAKWVWQGLLNYSPSDADDELYEQWIIWKIPTGEPGCFETRREPMIKTNIGGEPSAQWPHAAYSISHGYNEAYEKWLTSLAPVARAEEIASVFDRFEVEYTLFVKGILYFQILWPNSRDPELVTPANWDDEGVAIAERYNHRVPTKEHWLLPVAEVFLLYYPECRVGGAGSVGAAVATKPVEPARDEGNQRPVNRLTSKGCKPVDPK